MAKRTLPVKAPISDFQYRRIVPGQEVYANPYNGRAFVKAGGTPLRRGTFELSSYDSEGDEQLKAFHDSLVGDEDTVDLKDFDGLNAPEAVSWDRTYTLTRIRGAIMFFTYSPASTDLSDLPDDIKAGDYIVWNDDTYEVTISQVVPPSRINLTVTPAPPSSTTSPSPTTISPLVGAPSFEARVIASNTSLRAVEGMILPVSYQFEEVPA